MIIAVVIAFQANANFTWKIEFRGFNGIQIGNFSPTLYQPDKGSGVVIMDKEQYISLLKDASVNDHTKFRAVPSEKPKGKGRPPKYYHPLLKKRKPFPLSPTGLYQKASPIVSVKADRDWLISTVSQRRTKHHSLCV